MKTTTPLLALCFLSACGVSTATTGGGDLSSRDLPLGVDCDAGVYAYVPPPAPLLRVSAAAVNADAPTRMKRALLITDHRGFAAVENDVELSLAGLLRDLGRETRHMACLDGASEHRDDVEEYSRNPFTAAWRDVDQHNAYGGPKIGTVVNSTNSWRTVLDNWADGGSGPFRLLAVVNRLDLAGDTDARAGGSLAALDRRWLGEGRLVFGTTNILNGQVVPVTMILEFRLPPLRRVQETGNVFDLEVDPTFVWKDGPTATGTLSADEVWRRQRRYWVMVWRELIRLDPASTEYQQYLRKIVQVFARGENFLALRTGENLRDAAAGNALTTEFEYREFYLSNGGYNLTSRKTRREPMRCEDSTLTLVTHINDAWNTETNQDLHFDYAPGQRTLLFGKKGSEQDEIVGPTGTSGACGGIPFGNGTLGDIGFRANYVRFRVAAQNGIPATPAWQNARDTDELKRHKFAAGTCSGCHFSETGSPGFLIPPREANVDSVLPHFLNTNGEVHVANVFAQGTNRPYEYRAMQERLDTFNKFLNQYDFSADYLAGQKTFGNEMLFCNTPKCIDTHTY